MGWEETGRHLRRIKAINEPPDYRGAHPVQEPSYHQTCIRGLSPLRPLRIPSSQHCSLQLGDGWQSADSPLSGGFDAGCCSWLAGRVSRCRCLRSEIHANWIRSCSNERILPARAFLPLLFFFLFLPFLFFLSPSDRDGRPSPSPTSARSHFCSEQLRSGRKTEPKGRRWTRSDPRNA